MLIKDEVLERLRNGENLSDLRNEYRSSSQVSDAARMYVDWLQEHISQVRSDSIVANEENTKLNKEQNGLKLEITELSKAVGSLRSEKQQLCSDVDRKRQETTQLQSEAEGLEKRGLTYPMLIKLKNIEDRYGQEIWDILQDYEKAQRLRQEIIAGEKTAAKIELSVNCLENREIKSKKNIAVAQGKLDLLKMEVTAFGELADSLSTAAEKGYTQETSKEVQFRLKNPEIPTILGQSIGRLLPVLTKAENLSGLEKRTSLAEDRLAETLKLESEARTRVETIQNVALKTIECTKNAGEKAIFDLSVGAKSEVETAIVKLETKLNAFERNSQTILSIATGELSNMQLQKGQLQSLIEPAQVLLGVIQSTDGLRSLQPALVIQLLERIQTYMELHFSNTLINASHNQVSGELNADACSFTYFKISSIIKLAKEALQKQLVKS